MKVLTILGLAALLASPATAQQTPTTAVDDETGSLSGIVTLRVVVQDLTSDAALLGIKTEWLGTLVELRLRQAGIRVVPPSAEADAALSVQITVAAPKTREGAPRLGAYFSAL